MADSFLAKTNMSYQDFSSYYTSGRILCTHRMKFPVQTTSVTNRVPIMIPTPKGGLCCVAIGTRSSGSSRC